MRSSKYKVGQKVSVSRFDKLRVPSERLGSPGVITKVMPDSRSPSGWILNVKGASGRDRWLDEDEISPWDPNEKRPVRCAGCGREIQQGAGRWCSDNCRDMQTLRDTDQFRTVKRTCHKSRAMMDYEG